MSKEDNNELNEMLDSDETSEFDYSITFTEEVVENTDEVRCASPSSFFNHQFSQIMNGQFTPCGLTTKTLEPNVYKISKCHNVGLVFSRVSIKIEDLIHFPDSNSEKIIKEITCFWEKGEIFENFGLPHKRGILLWGNPGSGKSATVQLVMKDVIERGGVVFLFDVPSIFIDGYQAFRSIQPETPVVIVMEDLDEIIHRWGENEVLQILDGVHKIHRTVFLSTTNYPQKLKARVINRPSRFDKRFKIGFPNKECRKIYLESIQSKFNKNNGIKDIDIDKWVEDTEEFSFAHLKELFVANKILGDDYDEALETLRSMRNKVVTEEEDEFNKSKVGFNKA